MDVGTLIEAAGWWSYVVVFAVTAGETSAFIGCAWWTLKNGRFRLDVDLPPNTTAEILMPTGDRATYVVGSRAIHVPPAGIY